MYKPGTQKAIEEERVTVTGVLGSSGDFQDLAHDAHIVEGEIIDEDAPWDLRDLNLLLFRASKLLLQSWFNSFVQRLRATSVK